MAEKQERRSIADAMNVTPEALAFIKGTPEKTVELKQSPSRKAVESNEVDDAPGSTTPTEDSISPVKSTPAPTKRRTYRSIDSRSSISPPATLGFGMNNLLVPLTTRLQPSTAAALKRAGLEQKLRGQQPATVQEIAEIAIQGWLRNNGFLN